MLGGDEQRSILGQLCNVLDPHDAVAFSSVQWISVVSLINRKMAFLASSQHSFPIRYRNRAPI